MAQKITLVAGRPKIIGISDRRCGAGGSGWRRSATRARFDRRRGQPSLSASDGDGGAGLGTVSGPLSRSERATFSPEAGQEHEIELSYTWVKQASQERAGSAGAQARGASQTT